MRAREIALSITVVTLLLVSALSSLGCSRALVAAPRLEGLGEPEARDLLLEKGLRLNSKAEDHSESVPAGKVIWTDPGSGKELLKGSGVSIVVSTGPPPAPVPNLVGTPELTAQRGLDCWVSRLM